MVNVMEDFLSMSVTETRIESKSIDRFDLVRFDQCTLVVMVGEREEREKRTTRRKREKQQMKTIIHRPTSDYDDNTGR